MTTATPSQNSRFWLAVSFPFLALGIQWSLWHYIQPFVWFLFYPAVFFSARLGGLKAGIISTFTSAFIVLYFFMPPALSFKIENPYNLFSIIVFAIMGFLFSDLQENLFRANARTRKALAEIREAHSKVQQLYEQSLEAEKLKTHFFTNVSHELRTPLTLILNPVAELLKKASDKEQRHLLEMAERNARLMYRHVSDLLDIAKLEAQQMSVNYQRLDIAAFTRKMAADYKAVAAANLISLNLEIPEQLIVETDLPKYQRILQNLLSNALKYTPKSGQISLRLLPDAAHFTIEMEDNGIGIPEDQKERVFERFRQAESKEYPTSEGTGLGLAIVKEFAALLGGQVVVKDALPQGALFQVLLPLMAPQGQMIAETDDTSLQPGLYESDIFIRPESTTSGAAAPSPAGALPVVLIVDDNPDITDFLSRALSPGCLVVMAANGREGLDKAMTLVPDLIIADIMMPVMPGDVMVRKLNSIPKLADIPVIMLTAVIDEQKKMELLNEQVIDYIQKPFSLEEIQLKVESAIHRSLKQRNKIADAENRYKYVLDNMLEGAQIIGFDWRYLYLNDAAEQHSQRPRSELIGKGFLEMWPGIETTELYRKIKSCLEDLIPCQMVNEFEYPDGRHGWFNLSIQPVPEGVFILSIDITERINAAKAVQKSELLFSTIFHAFPMPISLSEVATQKWVEVNDAFVKVSGYSRDEMIGHTFQEFRLWKHPEERDKMLNIIAEQGHVKDYEAEILKKDGTSGTVVISVEKVDLGGKTFLLIMGNEITDRKQALENLRKSTKLLNDIMDNSPSLIYIIGRDGRFMSINREFARLFKKTPEEIIGKERGSLLPLEIASLHYMNDLEVIQKGVPLTFEDENMEADGKHYYLSTKFPLIDTEGNIYGICGISTDITDRKKNEAELIEAKEKAEESDRLKSAFLANMSHEIRTPMNAIIGFSNILTRPNIDEAKRISFTNLIQRRSYDLLHIIEDILDVSKIEVGQLKMVLLPTSISVLLNELFEFYQASLHTGENKSKLKIVLNLPASLKNMVINTDSQRLKQVLRNLIDNAIKFTDEGAVEFGVSQKSDTELIFYVKDSGIGIEPEKQTFIFDRFRQADEATTTRQYGGTGLGLSIVKGILDAFKCRIWLESEPGKGSTFFFNFLISPVEMTREPEVPRKNSDNQWAGKTILIVEDDEYNSLFLKELLEETKIKLLFAFNGRQAIEFINENPQTDLVFMDIRLPDTNGLAVTRELKKRSPGLIVIAQTAYARSIDMKACLDAGCNDYVAKPMSPAKVFELLHDFLG